MNISFGSDSHSHKYIMKHTKGPSVSELIIFVLASRVPKTVTSHPVVLLACLGFGFGLLF